MFTRLFYKLIILTLLCLSTEPLLGLNYPYRTIEEPIVTLPQGVKILQYSPARTGSTLVFNILNFIFEDILADHQCKSKRVIKTHSPKKYTSLKKKNHDVYLIATIRHPLDTLASALTFYYSEKQTFSKDELNVHLDRIIKQNRELYTLLKKIPAERKMILKYELMVKNYDYIFHNIKKLFGISLTEKSKHEMKQHFSRASMLKVSERFDHSLANDPTTGIHGNHINDVHWKEDISEQYLTEVLEKITPILEMWGFPVEPS